MKITRYDLCDAVIESGATIVQNNLEVYETILEKGYVKIGLYLQQ
jgi:hypothetical protein